jgi:hypothetical protein
MTYHMSFYRLLLAPMEAPVPLTLVRGGACQEATDILFYLVKFDFLFIFVLERCDTVP